MSHVMASTLLWNFETHLKLIEAFLHNASHRYYLRNQFYFANVSIYVTSTQDNP